MQKIVLSENHRRSVSSSMHIIEKMLLEIEKTIAIPESGFLSRTVNDMPDIDLEHFARAISGIKAEIRFISEKYNLRTEEIKMSRLINSRKAKMWETINDTSARKLKGYKEFPKEQAEEFDADMTKLRGLIDTL